MKQEEEWLHHMVSMASAGFPSKWQFGHHRYLSCGTRHADLLFEIISRLYEVEPTAITTNKPFSEWGEAFPSSSCVVSLSDPVICLWSDQGRVKLLGETYRISPDRDGWYPLRSFSSRAVWCQSLTVFSLFDMHTSFFHYFSLKAAEVSLSESGHFLML